MIKKLSLSKLSPSDFCIYAHHEIKTMEAPEPHTHDFYELFWVEKGGGVHWINGRPRPLQRGDLILIHAADAHAFSIQKEGCPARIVNFAFFADTWTRMRKHYFNGASVFFSAPSLEARSYTLDERRLAAIREAAQPLRSGLRDRLHAESFLLNVLTLLKADRLNVHSKARPLWLREACIAIGANRNFAGGIPALIRLTKKSPEHIAREFRRHLDQTPTDFINDLRMSYAAERLGTSDDEIVSIALDCGLENLGHFYRLFRSRYGRTPRAYRLQQRVDIKAS